MPTEDSLIDEAKQTLDQLTAEGYTLRQVKIDPRKGCRICRTEEQVHLTVIFAGKKISETKTFLYCMAKVCIPCLALGEAEESLAVEMTEGAKPEPTP